MARVVLAMSGGVDSSVAAALLLEAGHEVIGLLMRHANAAPAACSSGGAAGGGLLPILPNSARQATVPGHKQGCCSASDAEDARRVADRLGIAFYAVDFSEEFDVVKDYFVAEYSAGRTPNPCVVCNNWLKFGRLWDYAQSVGAERIATGHYALLDRDPSGTMRLRRGVDPGKDQSYVLFGLRREVLERVELPVGSFHKDAIRARAQQLGLTVAEKRDSQEICFIPDGDYARFVRQRRGGLDTAGEIVTTDGQVLGRHEGIEHYTVGQRKGLGVAVGERRYVVRVEADSRRVVVGTHHELGRRTLTARNSNWLIDPPQAPLPCLAQIRYGTQATAAQVRATGPDRLELTFDEPRSGVAPGQAVVCYQEDQVLGGGWIE